MKKRGIKRLAIGVVVFYLVSWSTVNMVKLTDKVTGLEERVAVTAQQCNNATELANQWRNQYNELLLEYAELKGENEFLAAKVEEYESDKYNQKAWQNAGEFVITHYCHCSECCGKNDGITTAGTVVQEGRTIAVDPEVIPLGSEVLINGQVYVAEDTGVSGNHIDIYVPSHEQALQMGRYSTDVKWR